ncbi:MAG: N-acetyltransferase [Alphaproteobacteria bacterium]|nr:N-acetyltransferase [Alphaproteobacteria bacterium]
MSGSASSSVEVLPVETKSDWRDFHRVLYRIYGDDPNWVAPILLERKLHFSRRHNPFFQHAEAQFWLARRNGRVVGRITAQIDALHLERYHDATGHIGFLEAIDDGAVFRGLFAAAESWLQEHKMKRAVGPVSFSMWDQPGLLVDGFDYPPSVLMGHARPYYEGHILSAGYRGIEDLIAYRYDTRELQTPQIAERIIARGMRGGQIVLRKLRMGRKDVENEIRLILDILNDGWSENWGFVTMTEAEAKDLGDTLKLVLTPEDCAIAELKGEPVAFGMFLPNLNEAARDLSGHLFPFGWAKLLWRLKVRRPKTARLALLGMRKSVQDSPAGGAIALAIIRETRARQIERGITSAELSWVLDRNERIKHIIKQAGARPYKRYRIYEKALPSA